MNKNEIDENSKKAAEKPSDKAGKAEGAAEKSSTVSLRKLKYGSMSLVTIALVITIVVIFNIMASYLVKRRPLKLDLTADKRYELSDETIDYLKDKLDKDVEIIVTCPKDNFSYLTNQVKDLYRIDCPYDMIPFIFEKYEMYATQGSGSVKVKYVDLDKDPKSITKYTDIYKDSITANNIIFYCDGRVRVIDQQGFFSMITVDNSDQENLKLVFAGESSLTSEIMNVTDANPINVAFAATLDGTPIYDTMKYTDSVSGLRDTLLTKNGYFCTNVDLSEDIDRTKYDMVVIPMPKVDFDKDVIERLNKFLYNDDLYDKDIVFFTDPFTSNTPNIYEFLEDWSIGVESGCGLVDDENSIGQQTANKTASVFITVKQSSGEEAGKQVEGARKLAAPYSQELKILPKKNEAYAAAVLETYDSAYNVVMTTNEKSGDSGVKNVGIVSNKQKQIGTQIDTFRMADSNVLAFGSGYLTMNELLTQTNQYSNADVLINIINQMTGKNTERAVIPDKALQQSVIAPTTKQDKNIKIIVIFIIPAIVAAAGLVVLIRRKNR